MGLIADIKTIINGLLPDNSSQAISAEDARQSFDAVLDNLSNIGSNYYGTVVPSTAAISGVEEDATVLPLEDGTYTNYSGLIRDSELCTFKYNGTTWVKEVSFKNQKLEISTGDKKTNAAHVGDVYAQNLKTQNIILKTNIISNDGISIGFFVDWTTGLLVANVIHDASDYISVKEGVDYYALNLTHYAIYDENYKFISGANGLALVNIPVGGKYIIVDWLASETEFMLHEGNSAIPYEAYKTTIPNLEVNSSQVIGLLLENIEGEITEPQTNFFEISKNLFNKETITPEFFVNWTNGELQSNVAFSASAYIPVIAGLDYILSGSGASTFIAWYDSAKVFISGTQLDPFPLLAPVGAEFVRVTIDVNTEDDAQLEQALEASAHTAHYKIIDKYIKNLYNGWDQKKWISFGDSITDQNKWQPLVTSELGLIAFKDGVGGSKISGVAADGMAEGTRITALPSDADFVVTMGGINDWAQNVALGTETSSDINEFNGALNIMLEKLSTKYQTARLILMTTTYGELYALPGGWPNAYTNTQGLTTRDYADAVRKACIRFGLPFVDLANDAGWNTFNISTYLTDDGGLIHPNDTGALRISELLIGRLKSMNKL